MLGLLGGFTSGLQGGIAFRHSREDRKRGHGRQDEQDDAWRVDRETAAEDRIRRQRIEDETRARAERIQDEKLNAWRNDRSYSMSERDRADAAAALEREAFAAAAAAAASGAGGSPSPALPVPQDYIPPPAPPLSAPAPVGNQDPVQSMRGEQPVPVVDTPDYSVAVPPPRVENMDPAANPSRGTPAPSGAPPAMTAPVAPPRPDPQQDAPDGRSEAEPAKDRRTLPSPVGKDATLDDIEATMTAFEAYLGDRVAAPPPRDGFPSMPIPSERIAVPPPRVDETPRVASPPPRTEFPTAPAVAATAPQMGPVARTAVSPLAPQPGGPAPAGASLAPSPAGPPVGRPDPAMQAPANPKAPASTSPEVRQGAAEKLDEATDGGRRRPTERQTVEALADSWRENGAPIMMQHYMATGQMDKAQALMEWNRSEGANKGIRLWARAQWAAEQGDFDTYAGSLIEGYNEAGYFDDGWTIDETASGWIGETGDVLAKGDNESAIAGGRLVMKDAETGKRQVVEFDSVDDVLDFGMTMAPERAFEEAWEARRARDAEASRLRTTKLPADPRASRAAAIRDELMKDSLTGQPTEFAAMSPDEQAAIIRQILLEEEAAISGAVAPRMAPLPTGPAPAADRLPSMADLR